MQGWRAWWDNLTPDEKKDFYSDTASGLAVVIIGAIAVVFRTSIGALYRRVFKSKRVISAPENHQPQPPPQPPQPVIIEVRTPTAPPAEPVIPVEVAAPPAPPSRIPHAPTIGFVARRDAEGGDIVERLKAELAPGRTQAATLSGPGGVGKSTLAAEAARELKEAFGGRVVWSSADGRGEFTLSTLLDDTLTQLDRADLRGLVPTAKAEQAHALVADPSVLVVMDNYETIEPAAQEDIRKWLVRAQCSALITSRHKVGETVHIPVAAMSPEEAREFLEKVIRQTQDSRVFSEKVRERIYKTAEANPYVMQWVVGQIDEAQEPRAVLEELGRGGGDAAARVFGRSFDLPRAGDDGRATLLALSLFAPSASRLALAAVAGFGDDLRRLNEAIKGLRALWLLEGLDENSRLAVGALTRRLARARMLKDKSDAEFRQRFVAYFLSYVQAHGQETPEDFNALEAERENLLAAMDAAFEAQQWQEVMSINVALSEFLNVRGYWDEAIRRGQQAVEAARTQKEKGLVAAFAGNVANIRQNRGEYSEAKEAHLQAVVAFKELGDDVNVAIGLHQLAMLAQAQGDIDEARKLYGESLEINKRLGDHRGIASTLHQLGRLSEEQGDTDEARKLYGESLEINKRLGDLRGIASTTSQLGIVHLILDEIAESRAKHEESLAIRRRIGDQTGIAVDLHQLGIIAVVEGNKAEAARMFRDALNIWEKLGSPYAEIARQNLKIVDSGDS